MRILLFLAVLLALSSVSLAEKSIRTNHAQVSSDGTVSYSFRVKNTDPRLVVSATDMTTGEHSQKSYRLSSSEIVRGRMDLDVNSDSYVRIVARTDHGKRVVHRLVMY